MSMQCQENYWYTYRWFCCVFPLYLQDVVAAGEEAAAWSARLLPFIHFLPNDPNVKHLLLTVLSELPCSEFLTDILAYCFPNAERQKGAVDTKLKRILARLGSGSSQEESKSPLSVRYHVRSQLVLANMATTFGKHDGCLSASWFPTGSDRSDNATVGSSGRVEEPEGSSFLFEHDSQYLQYLDTLFSVIILPLQGEDHQTLSRSVPPTVPPTVSLMNLLDHHDPVPNLSSHQPNLLNGKTVSHVSTSLYPLVNQLIRWSQMPYPLKSHHGRNSDAGLGVSMGRRKIARRRSRLDCSSMRVNLSAPIIVSCLRQKEDKVLEWTKDMEQESDGFRNGLVKQVLESDRETAEVRVMEREGNRIDVGKPDSAHEKERKTHFEVNDRVADVGEPYQPSGVHSPTLLGGVARDGRGIVRLLRVPEGVLQVQI